MGGEQQLVFLILLKRNKQLLSIRWVTQHPGGSRAPARAAGREHPGAERGAGAPRWERVQNVKVYFS